MEITMHLTILTRVVNGDRLVETLDWLALQDAKVYCLLKTLMAEVVHPSKQSHSRHHRPVATLISTIR